MRLTDRNLTMITGMCLAVGVGVAGFLLRDNATVNGFAQANASPSPVLALAKSVETSVPVQIPAHEDQTVLATMPRLMKIAPPPNANPVSRATVSGLCHVDVSAIPQMAAQVLLKIDAPCQPSTPVSIQHAGLSFREKLSPDGSLSLTIPAFSESARFDVTLQDGQQANATAFVHDLAQINRTAISWQGGGNVELQVTDFTGRQLSPRNPRSLHQALMDNGGYLTVLGNPDLVDPVLAQVATFFQPLTQTKTVSMALEVTGCVDALNLRITRVQPNIGQTDRRLRLALPSCVNGAGKVVLNNVLESMTMAQR